MDLPKCRTCGDRHPVGPCPQTFEPQQPRSQKEAVPRGLPRKSFDGQQATVSMMQLRASPGEIIDRVTFGMTIHVEKNGRRVASIVPVDTVIAPDGSFVGAAPLTMKQKF